MKFYEKEGITERGRVHVHPTTEIQKP